MHPFTKRRSLLAILPATAMLLLPAVASSAAPTEQEADVGLTNVRLISTRDGNQISSLIPGTEFFFRYTLTNNESFPASAQWITFSIWTSVPECDPYFTSTAAEHEDFPLILSPAGQGVFDENQIWNVSTELPISCRNIAVNFGADGSTIRTPSSAVASATDHEEGSTGSFATTLATAWTEVPGTLQYVVDGAPFGDAISLGPGTAPGVVAELTVSGLVAGEHTVVAEYVPADNGPGASVSAPVTFTVSPAEIVVPPVIPPVVPPVEIPEPTDPPHSTQTPEAPQAETTPPATTTGKLAATGTSTSSVAAGAALLTATGFVLLLLRRRQSPEL
ncbi:Ig-like domain-containing protein [Lysinibacter cavernae]|uniref:LPXTG-motif cell wall-anchored protein n=1 Tax=Lysinibacter cavernae TaxID=1640652 RepID=A0A7X5TS68_9MICO|nr:Ig-like domain-containing protein [Lysinibacter cavernae]NIH52600.1 LPXTG-motif cell wall-anchored protein [Lysinibacter cavernae]